MTPLDLGRFQAFIGLSEEEARERLGAGESETRRDVSYEGLEHVTELYNPQVLPARLFVRDGSVELVYVSHEPLEGVTKDELDAELGEGGAQLASSAGKAHTQYVFPERGVAYSADASEVDFLECFRPRSLEEYQAEIYQEPGPFIR